jgi:hypothetical protein
MSIACDTIAISCYSIELQVVVQVKLRRRNCVDKESACNSKADA